MKVLTVFFACLAAHAGVAAVATTGAGEGKAPHGRFTGDVKPVLYVADVERSAPFYRDVLGFELDGFAGAADDPYYAEMLAGPLKFGLHEPTRAGDDERVGRQRIYFRVLELEAHRRGVEERGGDPGEIVRRDWMDFFTVTDPDGNEIVLAVTDPERHTSRPWRREE